MKIIALIVLLMGTCLLVAAVLFSNGFEQSLFRGLAGIILSIIGGYFSIEAMKG